MLTAVTPTHTAHQVHVELSWAASRVLSQGPDAAPPPSGHDIPYAEALLPSGGAQGWHAALQSSSFFSSLASENKMQTHFLALLLFFGNLPPL